MTASLASPLLETHQIERWHRRGLWGRHVALQGVSCSFQRGVVNALLGENGAGKTTLIRVLLGQLRSHGGEVRWVPKAPTCRYLPEDGFLSPFLPATPWANALGASKAELESMARSLGVEGLLERPARTLSKGERRRVELALVLAAPVELYVLDEPTSGLDPRHLEDLKKVVRSLVAKGSTVVLSTHLLREWEDSVDVVVLLHRGRVVRQGALSYLLAPYRLWVPTAANPSTLPPEAFPLTGRALAPVELEPPPGWAAQPASLADLFLKETADASEDPRPLVPLDSRS